MHIEHSYIYNISCSLFHSLILFLSSLSWNVLYVICMQLHAVFGDTTHTQQCSKTRVNKITKTSTLTTIWCKNKLKLFSSTVNLSAQRKSVHRQEQNPQLPGKYFIDNHRAPKKKQSESSRAEGYLITWHWTFPMDFTPFIFSRAQPLRNLLKQKMC